MRRVSPWIKFGIPVATLVVIGVIVGAVVGTRHHHSSHGSTSSASSPSGSKAAASSAISAKNQIGIFPTATNSFYELPLYPSTVSSPRF
jgi:hypothetical protein